MQENKRTFSHKVWIIPLLLAVPVILALAVLLVKYGETAKDLIHVAIKMAVVS